MVLVLLVEVSGNRNGEHTARWREEVSEHVKAELQNLLELLLERQEAGNSTSQEAGM